ncbi:MULTISPECIES: OmcA/MtrC family decaheme c-type cytochrome [Anaeromyxobacter]|uniref:OmcA/MtrC family decaheme c-type cytochrome n=1 Tax=Anaeromyxobacter TaxID=161492 RepID=UPI001F595F2A|nr:MULTISPECIES: OmcA/MtrC family decaheme c-type cytochrome [unclassified Anaeromyxobacter]
MSRRFTNSGWAAAVTLALLGGCQQAPKLGAAVGSPPPTGPRIEIIGAALDAAQHVVVTLQISRDERPLGLAAARSLGPAFTLAALSPDPVNPGTALPAWRSLLLTGAETLANLPVAGPGTPDGAVLHGTRQPGAETAGTWTDQGGGAFTYTLAAPLPAGQDLAETLRVGAFLTGVAGTQLTTSTFDFVPNHGPLRGRELVLDTACASCHGTLRAHDGSRTGTRICVTCHTYQHADGQTVDPAAPAAATADTDPNPLELSRLVHRIHRGKNLPTLYVASSAVEAPPIGATSPKPFFTGRNTPLLGRRFSVIGAESRERIFGQVVARTDNGQPAKLVARGVTFPVDLRNCTTCHAGAAREAALATEISRRSCQGCHADVWFGAGAPPDPVHFAHSGGPQPDDTGCAKCHVSLPGDPADQVDIAEAHVAPLRSPRLNRPTLEIVEVKNALPGMSPTIVFTVSDRDGLLTSLLSPTPALDATSPVPRGAFDAAPGHSGYFEATIAGPADPDFRSLGAASLPISELVPVDMAADVNGRFSYTFKATLPADASGTWIAGLDTRRGAYTPLWDPVANAFAWPYTGESLYEPADTATVWIDLAAGGTGGGNPTPRRRIVDVAKCNACHVRIAYHGQMRMRVEYCSACHTPERTDWHARPKTAAGDTDLASTYDGIEERSIHFKVMIHRIHTGGRSGTAELSTLRPYVSYGRYGSFRFRDMGEFPGDLARCTLCHLEGTYRVEAVPATSPPTVANETPTIRHAGSSAHGADEPTTPPIAAACTACHATAYAISHAARETGNGKEQCVSCHGVKGPQSVDKVHRLPLPVPL